MTRRRRRSSQRPRRWSGPCSRVRAVCTSAATARPIATQPAVCSNGTLVAQLNSTGNATKYVPGRRRTRSRPDRTRGIRPRNADTVHGSRIVLPRSRERRDLRGARARARPHLPVLGGHQLRHRRAGAVRRVHVHVPASGQALHVDHSSGSSAWTTGSTISLGHKFGMAEALALTLVISALLGALLYVLGVPAVAQRAAAGEGGGLARCARRAAGRRWRTAWAPRR